MPRRLSVLLLGSLFACASSAPDAEPDPADATSSAATTYWRPSAGITWQIQLDGSIDTSVDASAYDVDMFDAPDAVLATLRARGRKIICYFSAGSSEDWRADFGRFEGRDKGKGLDGWAGERWLDVRSANVRAIMKSRLDRAKARGCDAIDADNVDGFANDTGHGLTKADSLDYITFLASQAHARGMAFGLKNALGLVPDLVRTVDFQINEQCLEFDECKEVRPFIDADKPVLHIEYKGKASSVCNQPSRRGFSTLVKKLKLDAWRVACP